MSYELFVGGLALVGAGAILWCGAGIGWTVFQILKEEADYHRRLRRHRKDDQCSRP